MRPRAGHVDIGPPKLILCKTRHDSHGVEKKVCLKIPSLSTKNQFDKVGLQFILHLFEVARPVSFSSP